MKKNNQNSHYAHAATPEDRYPLDHSYLTLSAVQPGDTDNANAAPAATTALSARCLQLRRRPHGRSRPCSTPTAVCSAPSPASISVTAVRILILAHLGADVKPAEYAVAVQDPANGASQPCKGAAASPAACHRAPPPGRLTRRQRTRFPPRRTTPRDARHGAGLPTVLGANVNPAEPRPLPPQPWTSLPRPWPQP